MSCDQNDRGVTVLRGEARVIAVALRDRNGDIVPLNSPQSIEFRFAKEDGTTLSKTLAGGAVTVVSDIGGRVSVSLSAVDTAALATGKNKDFYLYVTKDSKPRIVRFEKLLTVVAPAL